MRNEADLRAIVGRVVASRAAHRSAERGCIDLNGLLASAGQAASAL